MIVHLSTTHQVNDPRISTRIRRSLNNFGESSVVVGKGVKNHIYKKDIFFPRSIENHRVALIFFNFFFCLMNRRGKIFFIHDLELLILAPILKLMQKIVVYDVHENFRDLMPSRPSVPRILKIPLRFSIILFENFFSFFCDFITCPTEQIKINFKSKKSYFLPNYPLKSDFKNFNKMLSKEGKIIISYIGGISEEKGINNLIKLAKISQKNKSLSFHIAGKIFGLDKKRFISNLPKNTVYLGELDYQDVLRLLSKSNFGLCLLPPKKSYKESMPLKLYEYINSKTFVIASNFTNWHFLEDLKIGKLFGYDDIRSISSFFSRKETFDDVSKNFFIDEYIEKFYENLSNK